MMNWQTTCVRANPDWTLVVWNEDESVDLLRRSYPRFLKTFLSYPRPIFKVDAMKIVLAYLWGGIVMDMDIVCVGPMDRLVHGHDVLLAKESEDHLGSDFYYASRPFHPFFAFLLDRLMAQETPTVSTCPLQVAGPAFLQDAYRTFSTLFPRCLFVASHRITHPFTWNEYHHPCHSKNETFDLDACMAHYAHPEGGDDDEAVVFLSTYTASWH